MTARLCFVEDDPTISELVCEKLQSRGFEVQCFDRGEAVLEQKLPDFDLYILDRMLAGPMSGLELCSVIRKRSASTPVLILSALSEPGHRVEGLREGADDYLSKPFEMEELLLRVEGMLRRRSWYQQVPEGGAVFSWGDNQVDFERLEGSRRGKVFVLTQKECMLLKLLVENEGRVVSRDTILDRVWGYHLFPSTRTVDNFILRLRKYFEEEPGSPQHFLSVRGMGYRFVR